MKRIIAIDSLRGICLVIMMINHVGSPVLMRITDQPLGYFTAADCFIFISGLIVGLKYRQRTLKKRYSFEISTIWKRFKYIWLYHIIIYAAVLVLSFLVPSTAKGWSEYFPLFYTNKYQALGFGIFLLYQPSYFVILPLYLFLIIIFVFGNKLFKIRARIVAVAVPFN